MSELITPVQSETLLRVAAGVLLFLGAGLGWRMFGVRGILLGLSGAMLYGLWQFHQWMTRYDPQTKYFGLDKVWVLSLEVVLFVCLGVVLGIALRKTVRSE